LCVTAQTLRFLLCSSSEKKIAATMSRAFVKEDVDPPERRGRKRSISGLPPGATNYITVRGAKRLRDELEKLRGANVNNERIAELEQISHPSTLSILPIHLQTPSCLGLG
jgi:hypothetical protein